MSEHNEPRPVAYSGGAPIGREESTNPAAHDMSAAEEIQVLLDLQEVQTNLLRLLHQRDTELAFAWFWFMIAVSALGYVLLGGAA